MVFNGWSAFKDRVLFVRDMVKIIFFHSWLNMANFLWKFVFLCLEHTTIYTWKRFKQHPCWYFVILLCPVCTNYFSNKPDSGCNRIDFHFVFYCIDLIVTIILSPQLLFFQWANALNLWEDEHQNTEKKLCHESLLFLVLGKVNGNSHIWGLVSSDSKELSRRF